MFNCVPSVYDISAVLIAFPAVDGGVTNPAAPNVTNPAASGISSSKNSPVLISFPVVNGGVTNPAAPGVTNPGPSGISSSKNSSEHSSSSPPKVMMLTLLAIFKPRRLVFCHIPRNTTKQTRIKVPSIILYFGWETKLSVIDPHDSFAVG